MFLLKRLLFKILHTAKIVGAISKFLYNSVKNLYPIAAVNLRSDFVNRFPAFFFRGFELAGCNTGNTFKLR